MVCYVRSIRRVAFCVMLLVSESDIRNSCVSYLGGWMVGWLVELVGVSCVIYFLGLLVDRLVN
jgi:hypothetical protein